VSVIYHFIDDDDFLCLQQNKYY